MHLPDNENSFIFVATRGGTFFEISNHLGNVHLVLSDYLSITGNGSGNITGYHSSVSSASEYYPLGMLLVDGEYNSQSYRYGFNTMKKDESGNYIELSGQEIQAIEKVVNDDFQKAFDNYRSQRNEQEAEASVKEVMKEYRNN